MAREPRNLCQSTSYSAAEFGSPAQWREFILDHPRRGPVQGKTFLGQVLALTGMEVSFGSMLPGESSPALHTHKQNEELYVFLSGEGEMQVDGERIALRPGTAVRIAPAGVRAWRATGTEALAFMVIQAKAGSLEQASGKDGVLPDLPLRW
jgi:mannose-6-phosphate isomerase-like protein (cupin superfamily)